MNYKITLTDEAKAYLRSLDGRAKTAIGRKIETLKESPDKIGKALSVILLGIAAFMPRAATGLCTK